MNFTRGRLALLSLRHYRRAHLPTTLGIALAAAVLSGALLVGKAVRASLEQQARDRLGQATWAMESAPGRRISDSLSGRLPGAGAVLSLPAMLLADTTDGVPLQVNQTRVLGVDATAWSLISNNGSAKPPRSDEVLLGERLARRLGVGPGDSVSLRAALWTPLPRDAPLSARAESPTVRWRLVVRDILPDTAGGRFGLQAEQSAPLNAFVQLNALQERTGWNGFVNLLIAPASADEALRKAWTPEDLGITVREGNGIGRIAGDSVFLDTAVAEALPSPSVLGFTYLVDSIATPDGSRSTPYSFVTGLTPQENLALGAVPSSIGSDGIVLNQWLAENLSVHMGDTVVVSARRWETSGRVVPQSRTFHVQEVLSMDQAALERERMPAFPGLTDVERCAEWDIGMDLDAEALGDAANEAYWESYGPTPKALLPLAAVQEMAGTRFGIAMEARVPLGENGVAEDAPALLDWLRDRLDPAAVGLVGRDVAAAARSAARGATDFGGLFLGLSFFLMAAALLLAALLCGLGILRRAEELGTLRSVGFDERSLRRQMQREVAGIAALGSILGAILGAAYARALLHLLARGWSGALAGAAPAFEGSFSTVFAGAALAFIVSLLALNLALRATLKAPLTMLLAGETTLPGAPNPAKGAQSPAAASARRAWIYAVPLILALYLATRGPYAAMAGGAIVLATAVLAYRNWNRRRQSFSGRPARDLHQVGRRGALLRPGRDLAVMAVLGCGVFMVCAVTAMRQDVTRNAGSRNAPTGGFELVAELSVPLPDHELPKSDVFTATPLRVLDGEDAGCLNLNQAAAPRLIGVPVERFAELGVFGLTDEWRELDAAPVEDTVPAWTGDADTAAWGLKATLSAETGTVLEYRAGDGSPLKVRLVRSPPQRLTLFQGSVLVSSARLAEAYPGLGGSAMLLVDTPGATDADAESAATFLRQRYAQQGIEIRHTTDRLRDFYQVESTYLDMFLALGGLGLLVATVGVGLVVLRNAEERREEMSVLALIGFRRRDRARLLWEAAAPAQAAGLAAGALSAAVALWPALRQTGIPWRWIALLLLLVGASGALWSLALAWRGAREERL